MTDEKIEEELKEEETQAAEDAQTAETSGESAENGEVCEACEGCEGGEEKKKGSKEKEKDSKKDKKKAAAEALKLETRNAELEKAITEEKDRYARLAAEYDNYRKRTARELDGRYADAKADTWKSLLAVVDNFERALAAEPAGEEGAKDPFREGMELTYKQLKEQMEKAGVTEIEAKGKEFDPELHNAVMHCEDENLGENIVAEVFVKGYKLGDKVLRHSMVKVAN